ncbi:MAG: ABC transporter permease, partial [Phycisphaerae bacterium]|nr:ABC transporter permease [Phycisphaerae bacterium]
VVNGQAPDGRAALQKLQDAGGPLHAIACTRATAVWTFLEPENLKTQFPALADCQVVSPTIYRWPDFLKANNLLNVANQIAVIAIIAIGMTMVIITAGIDLSVGSLIALAAVVAALFIRDVGGGDDAGTGAVVLGCAVAIGVCAAVGLGSGAMVTVFGIPPFIVTLAVLLIAQGLAFRLSGGESVGDLPEGFDALGRGKTFGVPNAVLLMLALYVVAHVVMTRTTMGRYIYAVGGNPEAARLSGVPVRRVLLGVYMICGALAGLAGVIMASQFESGDPKFGQMYELQVIAAVVVGGTSLLGGEGKILATLIGALVIGVINNGMNLTEVGDFNQKIVLGAVILGAVLLDQLKKKGWGFSRFRRRRSARRSAAHSASSADEGEAEG